MSDYAVRIATPEDEDRVYDLFKIYIEENGIFEMDDDKVQTIIKNLTNSKNGVIGIIDGEDSLEGMICLIIDQMWYAKDWFLHELFNFVPEEYRRSTRAKALFAFAKNCSTKIKLPLVIGVVSNEKTEAKIKLYERQFPKAGAFFMYNEEYAKVEKHESV
jgi:hypothetical protein